MYSTLARFVIVTLLAGTIHAAPRTVSLKWNELSGTILDKNVIVGLKDGSSVRGVVVSVRSMELAVKVSNSNPNYKKGEFEISREKIVSLHLLKMGKRGRIIGTVTGAVAGLFGAGLVGILGSNEGAAGVLAGAPVAGYFIGRRLDRQQILIEILPD